MFISNKMSTSPTDSTRTRIQFPAIINVDNISIEVVSSFKLLGVTIDNRLNFLLHVANVRRAINIRLYSIHKLFYLPFQVKMQFFKSFVLPHFDYCASILIYFPKRSIQKLADCYYMCLQKLFNFQFHHIHHAADFNICNDTLQSFNLNAFQHRIFIHLSTFIHKIINYPSSPAFLRQGLERNRNPNHALRNNNHFRIPATSIFNHLADYSFFNFYTRFINNFLIEELSLTLYAFKHHMVASANTYIQKFANIFEKFNLVYHINTW